MFPIGCVPTTNFVEYRDLVVAQFRVIGYLYARYRTLSNRGRSCGQSTLQNTTHSKRYGFSEQRWRKFVLTIDDALILDKTPKNVRSTLQKGMANLQSSFHASTKLVLTPLFYFVVWKLLLLLFVSNTSWLLRNAPSRSFCNIFHHTSRMHLPKKYKNIIVVFSYNKRILLIEIFTMKHMMHHDAW